MRILQRRECGADDAHLRNERALPTRQACKLLRIHGNQGGEGYAALYAAESEQCCAESGKRREQQIKKRLPKGSREGRKKAEFSLE